MIGAWFKKLKKPRSRNRARVERAARQTPKIEWARWIPAIGVGAALTASVVLVVFALDRPIRHVDAVGVFRRVTVIDVEHVVRQKLHGGFVRANLSEVQAALESMPWVDTARVQRRWPDSLSVQITEQEAIARWGDAGLVNSRGELFVQNESHVPTELPYLVGPAGTERRVADLFFQVRTQLESAELSLGGLRLDERGAWEVELANGVVIRLGRREVQERIDRFLKSGAALVTGRAADIAYIDMRYSNGFAVGWRSSQSRTG
jgi:cell division protein FtsQ